MTPEESTKDVAVTVRIQRSSHRKLEEWSRENGRSLSNAVRTGINLVLKEDLLGWLVKDKADDMSTTAIRAAAERLKADYHAALNREFEGWLAETTGDTLQQRIDEAMAGAREQVDEEFTDRLSGLAQKLLAKQRDEWWSAFERQCGYTFDQEQDALEEELREGLDGYFD